MKVIITGATGLVATELLSQSLKRHDITSVVAVSRKPVTVPAGVDDAKLRNVVVSDYENYSEDARREFAGADACIWTVAITPSKAKTYSPEEVTRVCHTFTMAGLQAFHEANPDRPVRFVYMSGIGAERDQTTTPKMFPEYCHMRGRVESAVLDYAATCKGTVEALFARPGYITGAGGIMRGVMGVAMSLVGLVPTADVKEVSAAVLDMALGKTDAEILPNDDLVRVGRAALEREANGV